MLYQFVVVKRRLDKSQVISLNGKIDARQT